MAFDGVTIAGLVAECKEELLGARIVKIAQPEPDELLLTLKTNRGQKRLLLSASATLPLFYLTTENKVSPLTAPNFCMLLRKHLQNGRLLDITQSGLERVVTFRIEHLDELGDLCQKKLILELMGKHSNLIFTDENNTILDAIKHVSAAVSSLREVLPGRDYFLPLTQEKTELLTLLSGENDNYDTFVSLLHSKAQPLYKALYTGFVGISPFLAQELCYRAGLDADFSTAALSDTDTKALYKVLTELVSDLQAGHFAPCMAYEAGTLKEYCAIQLSAYENKTDALKAFSSMSDLIRSFYAQREIYTRSRQKSADLRRIVQTALERNVKKYDLQLRQMKDTEKRETYRLYGELLNTYGYSAKQGDKAVTVLNYYTNEELTIPLDEMLTPTQNAKRYYDKYAKCKRTFEALGELTVEVKSQIHHLESIAAALELPLGEEDLEQIREELIQSGYLKGKGSTKKGAKQRFKSKPYHYLTADGYHIYVGKNNFQNDELTFSFATGADWWFHAKNVPGSHVIVKVPNMEELPDQVFLDAARLAAYYSKGKDAGKVEIDYIQKKHVKKPNGAKPGFVVYYTNYSLVSDADISGLTQVE